MDYTVSPTSDIRKPRRSRIILADGFLLIRQALRAWIEKQQDLEVIAEAGDGDEVLQIVFDLLPDIIIVNIDLPLLNGLEITEQIKHKCPDMRVLILTPRIDGETLLSIKQSGASGYLTRNDPEVLVIYVLRRIIKYGSTYFPTRPRDTREDSGPRYDPVLHNTEYALSNGELMLLKLMANGLSNKEIALRLGPKASLRYVKAALSKIYVKLGVLSRTEAVAECLRKGIITLEDLI